MLNETKDLLYILKICDDSGIKLPKYVADSYDSLPPTAGFEIVAQSMVILIDEISSLKKEIAYMKEKRLTDTIYQQDFTLVKEDLLTIKGDLKRIYHSLLRKDIRRNSLLLQSLDISSNGNDIHRSQDEIALVPGGVADGRK